MTYTIADVFRPDLGSAADGLAVSAYRVSTWSGTNSPPHLGDTPPVTPGPDVTGTTSAAFGDYGAWELALPSNEDYFVAVGYDSSYYWKPTTRPHGPMMPAPASSTRRPLSSTTWPPVVSTSTRSTSTFRWSARRAPVR
jgi:hypothetical protein